LMRLVVLGYGFLGRLLVKVIGRYSREELLLAGVASSRGYVYKERGIGPDELTESLVRHPEFREGPPIEMLEKARADMAVILTPTNISTGEPGLTYIRAALSSGMDVVTADKGPLVVAFRELVSRAESEGLYMCYEATVGGGIPIFSLAKQYFRRDRILAVRGILNGTTNYVLSRMHFEGLPLDLALVEAQRLGIAERDPRLDLEGVDTACKIVILANALMGLDKRLTDVEINGITRISSEAMMAAKEMGMTIKLIGRIENGSLTVAPRLVRLNHPLCVHGTLNAIQFRSSLLGELTLIGEGAGSSTVASLVSDIDWILERRGVSKGNLRGGQPL
jgi:homoserine dehydrogenase